MDFSRYIPSWDRLFPFLRWWSLVTPDNLRADFFAGLTGAVIVLPQGVAFALIAGLPPEYGLYTAIVMPIVAGLFGSSRHLISGPTTAISIVLFATISPLATPGTEDYVRLALTLTFIAGVYQFLLGMVRMGALVNFISHSVVIGFTAGAAILIATSQMQHYFGVQIPRGESFLHTWQDLFKLVPEFNLYTALVASVTLLTAIAVRIRWPRWPALLPAMIAGSLVSLMIGGAHHGVALLGSLPASLPPLSQPDFSVTTLRQLGSGALAIAMLGLIEAVSIARSIAVHSRQRINGNQEFIGQGLSNIAGSFLSSYAGSGSFTRSGINYQSGAQTPLSGLFAALILTLVVLLIAPLTAWLPIASMAGVILLVAYNLIDFHHIRVTLRTSSSDAAILVTTFAATLFVELEFAIYVGVMLSLILYLNRTARPRVFEVAPDPDVAKHSMTVSPSLPRCPQLCIVRIEGSIFFGAVDHVGRALQMIDRRHPDQRHVLIICTSINFVDAAGGELLASEARRHREEDGGFYMCNARSGVTEPLMRSGNLAVIGAENVFKSKKQAISEIFTRLDRDVCQGCAARIFRECATVATVAIQSAGSAGLIKEKKPWPH